MNKQFTLTTDTSCDIFRDELKKLDIPYIPLSFNIDGITTFDEFTQDSQYTDFYDKIRNGAMPTTSQINTFLHEEFFEKVIAVSSPDSIIHMTLSSGMSGTYESAVKAAENVMTRHKTQINILDTLSATQGHRLILEKGIEMRDSGMAASLAFDALVKLSKRIHHWIIVDDLMHLKRGGRVSGASAAIGTLLKIKPILILNNLGKLAVVKKAMGTIKALTLALEVMEKYGDNINGQTVYIAHADCIDLATQLKEMILKKYKCEIKIGWIGPVIGSHTGSGTLGVVFETKERLTNK